MNWNNVVIGLSFVLWTLSLYHVAYVRGYKAGAQASADVLRRELERIERDNSGKVLN